jgi:tetratricopeptide (TPR) repeat protein
MELTIEQALQQGLAAHKEGKLQEAERSYRAILQSQPAHPDANHNLGVLAVSVNKADAALPLFKTALEANPKMEQFWLSYIEALIKEKQFDNAKAVLEQAKQQGVAADRLNSLEAQLSPKTQIENVNSANPSQQKLNSLLEYYQNGRFGDAEKLSVEITQDFPKHQFSWKVLGAVLRATGRKSEAVNANQTAVSLSPQDAKAHYNLGITLQELGRFDETEASYKQAIELKPDYAEAHNNLGKTLKLLGRLDEAEASCSQAMALKPDFAEAHFNLGNTLQELGRLDEAEASYTQAIALQPDHAKAHNHLLNCLFLQDKKSIFFDELDYLINQDKASAVIGSLTCRSALKYGVEKPNLFCRNPLQYVLHIDMNTQYDFEAIFVETARLILDERRISNRKQSLLVNGSQTSGNLFDVKNSFIEKIQKAIRLEIEKYQIHFKDSKDGFIKKWPTNYSLHGWLIRMKSGGELKPHIHDNGWLSGSVYINVPPKLKAESGNLVVSLGEEKDGTDKRRNVKEIINVVTGSLVLFPASLTHYTIPFEAEEERIVLAFDVK